MRQPLKRYLITLKRGFHQWHKHNVSVAWQQAQQQQQQKKCTRNRKKLIWCFFLQLYVEKQIYCVVFSGLCFCHWRKCPEKKWYTAISRKVVGKSARDSPERYCGWFWVLCSSKKFEKNGTGGHGHMFASAKGKQQKYVWQLQSSGTVYWSYPIFSFGIVVCTFFPTTFLEIAVCM